MTDLRRDPKLFGSPRRTQVLLLLVLLGESYPSELMRLLGAKKAAILQILDSLELEGVVGSRQLGRTRRVSLNPRYFAAEPLRALLEKLASASPELQRLAATRRARPRRRGKPL
jgi:DNA-binding transcriptional ArsR family regulator